MPLGEDYLRTDQSMPFIIMQYFIPQCQFWFEDVSATVVRVGKYSAECKTKEAIETLYKQFNKFIEPTVPQQEERIQQIIDLAEQLYGEQLSGNALWGKKITVTGESKCLGLFI